MSKDQTYIEFFTSVELVDELVKRHDKCVIAYVDQNGDIRIRGGNVLSGIGLCIYSGKALLQALDSDDDEEED